ncbi:MAG: hypothetical protein IT168_20065 [Bryobacterales bacterium]|nr:hypothetical protein [Bryobacterales bacterium]
MPTDFPAPYDRTTKIVTAVSCGLLLGVALLIRQPVVTVISALIIGLAYAYSPRSYRVTNEEIAIRRLVGSVSIPIGAITELRNATPEDLRGSLRLFGSGGMFGYYGLFRTSRLGRAWWYVTDRSRMVVVVTDTGTSLLSPENPQEFLEVCHRYTPVRAAAQTGEPIPRRSRWQSAAVWVGIAVGVLSIGLVAAAFLYAPGPPQWTLTPESLRVHDRFYPVTVNASEVDVDHVRVVDIRTDAEWRPTMRTNGFANSHYRSGWFRTANGQSVRMYRAQATSLVLLPAKDHATPVLIEVADPLAFKGQIQREWVRNR